MSQRIRLKKTHDHSSNSQKELASEEAERMANADTTRQKREHVPPTEVDEDILEEIDTILEENGFALRYEQKGGQ